MTQNNEIEIDHTRKDLSLEDLINLVLQQLSKARRGELSEKMCSAWAAASLEAQIQLASEVADSEFDAREAKNHLENISGERAIEIRAEDKSDKKITDAAMASLLAKDPKVREAKKELADKEKISKKFALINNTLSNAHIFFRGLDKAFKGL